MAFVTHLLAHNPLLMLFAVVALGYPISKIRVAGASFGIASILFAGIALGAVVVTPGLDPVVKKDISREMKLIYELGLAIFVYAMGLAIAHSFWASFSKEGIKKNAVVAVVMFTSTALVVVLAKALRFDSRYAAGLLAGSFTNMPALAGVIEALKRTTSDALVIAQPTVASAIAYPIGVLVPMLSIPLSRRIFKVDLEREAASLHGSSAGSSHLKARTIEVEARAAGRTHVDLREQANCKVVFNRLRRGGEFFLAPLDVALEEGDLLVVVGTPEDVERAQAFLGRKSDIALQHDISEYDSTRVFVSNHDLIGRPLRDLQLPEKHNCMVSRLRRGDVWFVPDADTVLELGDRIRVATARDNIAAVEELFGDSYRELSEASFLTFAMGMALGLAVGQIPIPLGHGIIFKLGFAGGPLVVGLALGRFHKMGHFVWNIPYSANHTIRQFGLVLFAAGIGVISGEGFRQILARNISWLPIFMASALMVATVADTLAYWLGHKVFRIPLSLLFGIVAGTHTQPVVLGYATQQSKNDLPNVGFAAVYPLATILKIVLAQALLAMAL
ncbi:aspartate:alanine exchanger family transporter [Mesoterricola silvestris]|uniref:Transporter n=1 Tax=Mesoterricola silvestris TaxID=2927979 RepID=A0AA48K908_9BACT|nr:aspartate:alanine exchanger family transporter [Mesoterricola silvestris]BDU72650.1 putative transporter [Mesoterricola silvestris]